MSADSRRIIVVESHCGACSVHAVVAYHQNFPEMRTEDVSAELAARHLADHLAAALENVSDASRRAEVQIAIDDARAFLDRDGGVHIGRDVARPGTL
ncbi:MAG: hypothetical protein ABI353_24255 [Isosphaeraceae bacterium]